MPNDKFDLAERREVVRACIRNLESRLLAVRQPEDVLAHVERLRKQAAELEATAKRIEERMCEDFDAQAVLREDLERLQVEDMVLSTCIREGIRPNSMRRFLERAIKLSKEAEGKE